VLNVLDWNSSWCFRVYVGIWQRNFELAVCVRARACVRAHGTTCCGPSYHARARARAHTHTHTHTHTAGSKLRCQTPTKHTKTSRVISVKHSSVLPDDRSHTIRNMSEWFLIVF